MFTVAYSYLRYSSPKQEDGDSVRRQTALARAWCDRNKVPLDTTRTYEDRGLSGFHGKNRKGKLGRFLADIEAGDIPRGSVLVLENLDRLSRENPWNAIGLLCDIVNSGVAVVTLSPSEMLYQPGRDLGPLIMAVVQFGRAHDESASKSERLSEMWAQKQQQARENGAIVTRRLPAWVREQGGRLVLVPERAEMVRRMFEWCIRGHGIMLVVKRLTEDRVQPWGRATGWTKAYVRKILTGRVVLGEYQPRKGAVPDGEAVRDYYPAVIDEGTWEQAQAALQRRKDSPGRVGKKVASLFTGLVWDGLTQGRMLIATQTRGRKGNRQHARVLVSADSMDGRAGSRSYPYAVFEAAVLKKLQEVKAADVLGEEPATESQKLVGELARVRQRRRQIEAALTDGDEEVAALARAARELAAREKDLTQQLAVARQKEANPKAAAWAEATPLMQLAAADEGTRLRLRDLLRVTIESIWVAVVPIRSHRLAAVQVNFIEGGRRDYLIDYRSAGYKRDGGWDVWSLAGAAFLRPAARAFDLRDPADARALETVLNAIDLETLLA